MQRRQSIQQSQRLQQLLLLLNNNNRMFANSNFAFNKHMNDWTKFSKKSKQAKMCQSLLSRTRTSLQFDHRILVRAARFFFLLKKIRSLNNFLKPMKKITATTLTKKATKLHHRRHMILTEIVIIINLRHQKKLLLEEKKKMFPFLEPNLVSLAQN